MPSISNLVANTSGGVWSHSRAGSTDTVKPFRRPITVVWSDGEVQHIEVTGREDWLAHPALRFASGRCIVFAVSGHQDGLSLS